MDNLPLLEFSYYPPDLTKKLLAKKKIEDFGEGISQKLYKLFCINEHLSRKHEIRVLDESEEDQLFLFHYIIPGIEVNHIRGLVVHICEGECSIYATSIPFSEDIMIEDVLEKGISIPFHPTSVILEVNEGTILRIFQGPITKKWYVSTHKKLDGRKSRWSGETFGVMLKEVWPSFEEEIEEYLSSEWCYLFVLAHPENRLVCTISPSITLIARYSINKMFMDMADDAHLLKPHPSITSTSFVSREDYSIYVLDDLLEYVRNIPWQRSTGVFVYEPLSKKGDDQSMYNYFKLTHYEYMKRRLLRGNEPNLALRYLEFKMEAKEYLPDFLELFSDRKELFEEVEKNVKLVVQRLKKCYNRRYKMKEYCIFPQQDHIFLKQLNEVYRPSLTVEQNIERGLWKLCSPRQLNMLIKNMLMDA